VKCYCSEHLAPLNTWADVERRIAVATELHQSFKQLYFSHKSATAVWRCEVCGQHWGDGRPYAEHQGDGPSCYFPIEWDTRHEDMDRKSKNIHALRRNYEDSIFIDSLGPEVGPAICKTPDCERLTVRLSSKCREHHFRMIRGYDFGSTDVGCS